MCGCLRVEYGVQHDYLNKFEHMTYVLFLDGSDTHGVAVPYGDLTNALMVLSYDGKAKLEFRRVFRRLLFTALQNSEDEVKETTAAADVYERLAAVVNKAKEEASKVTGDEGSAGMLQCRHRDKVTDELPPMRFGIGTLIAAANEVSPSR